MTRREFCQGSTAPALTIAVLAGVIERRAGGGNASARVEALNLHIGVVPHVTCDFTQVLSGPSFSCFATARGREAGL